MNKSILKLENIHKCYESKLHILNGVNFEIAPTEGIALIAPSGAGKSTLLHIAGLLDAPTSGQIYLNGIKASAAVDKTRTQLRQDYIGFVYQTHLLLPDFSALENIMIPQLIAGKSKKEATERACFLLEEVGLIQRKNHRSGQLSGGERQRIAIARALANAPKLLIADEPTGNLDPKNALIIFDMLIDLIKKTGMSALIATHNPELAAKLDRQVTLSDGKIQNI